MDIYIITYSRKCYIAIKLDMESYDRLEWTFIKKCFMDQVLVTNESTGS